VWERGTKGWWEVARLKIHEPIDEIKTQTNSTMAIGKAQRRKKKKSIKNRSRHGATMFASRHIESRPIAFSRVSVSITGELVPLP
jgi:hypothetical protein